MEAERPSFRLIPVCSQEKPYSGPVKKCVDLFCVCHPYLLLYHNIFSVQLKEPVLKNIAVHFFEIIYIIVPQNAETSTILKGTRYWEGYLFRHFGNYFFGTLAVFFSAFWQHCVPVEHIQPQAERNQDLLRGAAQISALRAQCLCCICCFLLQFF